MNYYANIYYTNYTRALYQESYADSYFFIILSYNI